MDWAAKGAAAMATGSSEPAVYAYTQALLEHPHSPDYFAKRAAAFTRLKPQRHDLALRDAEYSILLGQKRANREKIQAGQQRRIIALYGLGRYEDAKYLLGTMKKWRKTGDSGRSDQMEHDMWMAKINNKLTAKAEEPCTVKEYPDIDLPNEKDMKNWLQGQISGDGKLRYDALTASLSSPSADVSATSHKDSTPTNTTSSSTPTTSKPTLQPVRNDFFQNNDNLVVTFYAKKVDQSKVTCSIEAKSVVLSFPHPEDPTSQFTYSVNPTFSLLDPGRSASKVFGTKVELTLAKAEKGVKWPGLEPDIKVVSASLPNPYSSKTNTDWDKKATELSKKPPKKKGAKADDADGSDADSDYGGDAVDGFFKKLYAGADEDTRRAMMKSFQESNGTALSTNWSEVSKGHVDEVKSKDEN